MIKKYISKFTIDIAPSIIATIVGAYIVNHYISPKSDDAKPATAASVESKAPDLKAGGVGDVRTISLTRSGDTKSADIKSRDAKPAESSADLADAPDAATFKAKSADKAAIEKAATDKTDPASAETRRHGPAPRDKAVAKATPVTPAVVAPVLATVGTAPTEPPVDDRRDANDLARAAIERLSREAPRAQEANRAPEVPRAPEPPRIQEAVRAAPQQAQPMQQLPPPIVLATPSVESYGNNVPQAQRSDSRRPRPPGDIPGAMPLDIEANAAPAPRPERTNVAEDVLSAAKSVFHSVTPRFLDR